MGSVASEKSSFGFDRYTSLSPVQLAVRTRSLHLLRKYLEVGLDQRSTYSDLLRSTKVHPVIVVGWFGTWERSGYLSTPFFYLRQISATQDPTKQCLVISSFCDPDELRLYGPSNILLISRFQSFWLKQDNGRWILPLSGVTERGPWVQDTTPI